MKVKVCGMTLLDQLQKLVSLGVDYAGFIFYEKSARYVGDQLLNQLEAVKGLNIKRVGVFVNESIEEVKKRVEEFGLDYVQLHGDESTAYCQELKAFVSVIKVIRMSDDTPLNDLLKQYEDACDYFLFDTDSKHYGGTGKRFNWEIIERATITKPFFLSGGIGIEDVEELKAFKHPQLFAVDVNSRLETTAGVKDMEKVEAFMDEVKRM